ncbi:cell wall-binding repeat-containing protein [Miniphocaeibacter massiliensis]|uniref:cell wall-binding repeat-containing protein n=1 Tax=Miniphocaeibacter massiliensis TaxID=2041841 RepID=UPI0013EB5AB8|nr:cell wall-binding repeat-containing protein [Miniphocaeibacter massiliensis]
MGATRYETIIAIGKEVRNISGNKVTAILVAGINFPDTIAMTNLRVEGNMPILLTEPTNLKESVEKSLKDWKVEKVIIGGGEVAVSKK